MGASTSTESAGKPRIVTEQSAGDQDTFSYFIQQLNDLEQLIPVSSALEDLAWNDLRFLAEAGSNPDEEDAQKRLKEFWKLLADWYRSNENKVESRQKAAWSLFADVQKLAQEMKDKNRVLADACGTTLQRKHNLAALKSTALSILEEVEDISTRVEMLSKLPVLNKPDEE